MTLFPGLGAAQEFLTWGGEWKETAIFTIYDESVEGRAQSQLQLGGRTLTYPLRAFFSGRLLAEGPIGDSRPLGSDGSWRLKSSVDRLYLRLYLPYVDVSVGKQIVNWGVGYAWDPTDVFNPPDPTDPTGERPGILSAVVQIPVGPLDHWSLAAAERKFGLRRRGNAAGTDWAVVALSDRGDTVVGTEFKGDLGVGWHFAAAYRLPQEGSESALAGASWQAVAGADYSWFDGRLLWLGEYYVQRDGAHHGVNYTYQQLSYGFDEFSSGSVSLLARLPKGERVWNATVSSVLGDQSELVVGFSILEPGQVAAPVMGRKETLRVELSKAF